MRMVKCGKLLPFILVILASLILPACNTVEGIGEDLESTGEAIQDE